MSNAGILPYGRYEVANRNYGLLLPGQPGGEIIMTLRPRTAQTIIYTWSLERPENILTPESTYYVLRTEDGGGWLGKTAKPTAPSDKTEGLPSLPEYATIVTDKNDAWVFTIEKAPDSQGQSVDGKETFRLVTINDDDFDKLLLTVTNLTTDLLITGVVQVCRQDQTGAQENSGWEMNLVLTGPSAT